MEITVARSPISATTSTTLVTSPVESPGDLLTFDLPPGYGLNGTIVMDTEKSAQYLQEELGLDIDTYMGKFAKILPVLQENNEYKFPEGSGLEGRKKTKMQEMRCLYPPDTLLLRIRVMRCTRAGTICKLPPRRPIGRPPSRINENTSEQSFGWEEYPEDTNRIPDANGSMRSGSSVASVMSLLSDDAQWGLASAPSVSTFTSMRSNNFLSPSPTLQLDLGELINDFTHTPANGVPGAMGTNDPGSPGSTTKTNRGFVGPSQSNDIAPTPLSIGGDVRISHSDPMPGEGAQGGREEDINYIRQLCDIHAALVQHPLYGESLTRQARPQARAGSGARISDLQLGRLFALTVQLKGMTGHVLPIKGGGTAETPRQPLKNSATVLLALSCYVRLDQIYSRAVDALREVHSSDQKLDDSYQLMSGLTIDGFSLGACQDFQLKFVLQLCEQIHQRLGATVERARTNVAYRNKGVE
ncbi:hypothetical protein DL764_010044 [Monosporascus ibericus]|uniref:Uncharacterized protein n=1 Tax=Monosporascus ibericus TaxID=155417 RepID=A0A4Q4SWF1_9PEZI|nr:hypothetical protein DL764_010044 [Monosporascus ibericus]